MSANTSTQQMAKTASSVGVYWQFLTLAVGGLLVVLATAFVVAGMNSNADLSRALDAGSVITIVTFAAVGIERAFETIWTVVDTMVGKSWPMGIISSELKRLTDSADTALSSFYMTAQAAIKAAADAEGWTADKLAAANAELDAFKAQLDGLRKQHPNDSGLQQLVASISKTIDNLQSNYEAINKIKVVGDDALAALSELVDRFKTNPGRVLISIYCGVIAGMVVSGSFHLDLFGAIFAKTTIVGIILTGVTMGLGSNPAHEIIRAIQELKNSKKEGV